MPILKLICKKALGPLVDIAPMYVKKNHLAEIYEFWIHKPHPYFNGLYILIIQYLSVIDCLIRVEGLHVLNNNEHCWTQCWTLLYIVICIH